MHLCIYCLLSLVISLLDAYGLMDVQLQVGVLCPLDVGLHGRVEVESDLEGIAFGPQGVELEVQVEVECVLDGVAVEPKGAELHVYVEVRVLEGVIDEG